MTRANKFSVPFPLSPPSGIPVMPTLLHLMVSLNSPIVFHFYHTFSTLHFSLIVFRHSVFGITESSACSRLLCVPCNVFLGHFPVF